MADKNFFKKSGEYTIGDLAKIGGCKIENCNDENLIVNDVNTIDLAKYGDITFFSNIKYLESFKTTKASVCIVEEKFIKHAPENVALLISDNAYNSYAVIANYMYPMDKFDPFISEMASIAKSAKIGKNCFIGDFAVIMDNAVIHDNAYIGHGSFINDGVSIGSGTVIKSNVTVTHSIIGSNCIIHSGVRIGQDGFGFAPSATGITKVPQLGRVLIGNNVEIGSNTTIDRGAIGDTEIGDFTKIDNLVQIGHNVKVGKFTIIVAQVAIAGSTTVGDKVMIGGQTGIGGHINIGDGTMIAGRSGLMYDTEKGDKVGGSPAMPLKQFHRMNLMIQKMLQKKTKGDA